VKFYVCSDQVWHIGAAGGNGRGFYVATPVAGSSVSTENLLLDSSGGSIESRITPLVIAALQKLFAKVGSSYPLHENFRLTPEAKEMFT
jgi:hypothetical protein